MCGIYGVLGYGFDQGFLERATSTLTHRGPDAAGYYLDHHIGLGHRRLSIIDLSGGQQPIYNEDRTRLIICNGEIFNHVKLRNELIAKGHIFATSSDSEVALHAWEEWGEASIERLRGMFAYAIWDIKERILFIGRDRLGIKPVFFSAMPGRFSFASEMKAILADSDFPRVIDEKALATYFNLSYIPGEMTIFQHIRKLLPGHTITVKDGEVTQRKYWDLHHTPDRSKTEKQFVDGFMDLLHEAVDIVFIVC